MILSFSDKETEKVFRQEFSPKLPTDIQKIALRKLMSINAACCLGDLKKPPSNHLEKLKTAHRERWSIRINKQWRICFTPLNDGADYIDVTIIDYH